MKFLLLIVFVVAVFWLWSHNRRVEREQAAKSNPPPSPGEKNTLTEMVACDICQVHLPRNEALIGAKGIYCSDAHRRQAGQ